MSVPVRVVLADDQALVRAGVRRVLESTPGITVVAEAEDGDAALRALKKHEVDVLVLDLNMPGRDGFEVLRELRGRDPRPRVLVLSLHADAAYVTRAVQDGADGYILKDHAVDELPEAIRAVLAGRGYFSPRVQRALTDAVRGGSALDPLAALSARELEVLKRVAAGRSSKEIGVELNISVRTVESHRANLTKKLDLHTVAELTRFALERGLLRAP